MFPFAAVAPAPGLVTALASAGVAARVTATPPVPRLDDATVRALEPALLRLAARAVRDRSVACDIVQSAFLAVLEGGAAFDPARGPLRSFLAGVVVRKAVDHFRRRGRERAADDPEEALARVAHDPSRAMHPADRRRAIAVVDEALGRLPDLQRLAVLACDVEELDRAEAAASLGVTEGNLRVLLHRGRHQVRKALEDAGMR